MKRIYRFIRDQFLAGHSDKLNLLGDRDIEWSWVASQMPKGSGEALDFGPGGSSLGLVAAEAGFNVTAVDQQPIAWLYHHPHLHFTQGDILKLQLPESHFDLIINCSVIEHVGLAGRYGVTEDLLDGDLDAMERLKMLLKPEGIMLLTIPVGKDAVFPPLHRVYGEARLPLLLSGYIIEKEQYWTKDMENKWIPVTKKEALNRFPQERLYGLGCFILKRKGD
ncbi:class I SAM-dependent methyltransferase [Methanoculleus chikugoensis]|uniref:Methyltransferase type 11 domain-containing protein n=1 Tax=Methanoculleus chikugoensis TaxID=118126 RepID=A0ABN5XIU8_9EURY|nr:DUF268 domain-containing protein [Methanoculleus chikugoensis]BBL68639.1 hypothetical protein MchiMG62_18200 [Methanoculleus chikugoensis]